MQDILHKIQNLPELHRRVFGIITLIILASGIFYFSLGSLHTRITTQSDFDSRNQAAVAPSSDTPALSPFAWVQDSFTGIFSAAGNMVVTGARSLSFIIEKPANALGPLADATASFEELFVSKARAYIGSAGSNLKFWK